MTEFNFAYGTSCPHCGSKLYGAIPVVREQFSDFREIESFRINCDYCRRASNVYFQKKRILPRINYLDDVSYKFVRVEKASDGWVWDRNEDKLTVTQNFAKMVHNLMQGRIHNLDSELLHAALGMGTESGEIQTIVKRNMFYNEPIDILALKAELGDLLHYIQMCAEAVGSSIEEIMAINIAKLTTRYPNGYTRDKALVRDKMAERIAMEKVEKEYHG